MENSKKKRAICVNAHDNITQKGRVIITSGLIEVYGIIWQLAYLASLNFLYFLDQDNLISFLLTFC